MQGISPLFAQFRTVLRLTFKTLATSLGPTSGWLLAVVAVFMPPFCRSVLFLFSHYRVQMLLREDLPIRGGFLLGHRIVVVGEKNF